MENKIVMKKYFCGLLARVAKDAISPNVTKKIFVNSHKTSKFAKVFSLESLILVCP